MMQNYNNFQLEAYIYTHYLEGTDEQKIQQDINYFKQYIPLKKVYIENHRGLVDISQDKLRLAKEVFDEIIMDDYFFMACRCEQCIQAKGTRSWSEYRLGVMEEFSKEIVQLSKSVNPNMNFIIKYPNWYESYRETGYNPEKQKNLLCLTLNGCWIIYTFLCWDSSFIVWTNWHV